MSSHFKVVRSLGVDLASQDDKTGICVVAWQGGRAEVEALELKGGDDRIIELASGCEAIGIDTPFGWPDPFVRFVSGRPSGSPSVWCNERRDELRFRRTDYRVKEITERWPLSVSSDLIAVPAMRCAGLLSRMDVANRAGDGRVFEAYPAAALARWRLPSRGYKGPKARKTLVTLVDALLEGCTGLEVNGEQKQELQRSDDLFDALVCALIARAAMLEWTDLPAPEDQALARREGWIHVPAEWTLPRLVAGDHQRVFEL